MPRLFKGSKEILVPFAGAGYGKQLYAADTKIWGKGKEWKLDISNLPLENHTMDNGMVCTFTNPSNFSKVDGNLVANTTSGSYGIMIKNLDVLGKVSEIDITLDNVSIGSQAYAYIGAIYSYLRMSWDTTNYASWLATRTGGKEWTHYNGTYFSGSTSGVLVWTSRQGVIPVEFPTIIKITLGETMKVFFNGVLIAEKENDVDSYPETENWYNFEMNSGGRSNSSTISLKSLVVKYE